MLEEWIRNIPPALVERIAADPKVQAMPMGRLAAAELERRRDGAKQAA